MIDFDEAVRLYNEGHSLNQLGETWGCSPNTVSERFKKHGIQIRNRNEQRKFTYGIKPIEGWWKLYEQGLSTYQIAEKYGVVQDKVREALIKAGYHLRIGNTQYDLPWDDILSMYENKKLSMNEIARKFKCDRIVIHDGFIKLGIKSRSNQEQCHIDRINGRRHYCNIKEDFFDTWNPEMAYVLGWIYSDGNLHKKLNSVSITSADLETLENIGSLFGTDIHMNTYFGDRMRKQVIGKIFFHRKPMIERLMKIGLTPKKARTIAYPKELPNQFARHFIRGFFEGDGYVYISTKDRKTPSIQAGFCSSSYQFLASLNEKIYSLSGAYGNIGTDKKTGVSCLKHHGIKNCRKLYKFLYKGVPDIMILKRKQERFENYYNDKVVIEYGRRKSFWNSKP
jgi:hypothetical protein